jgi:hypothetical protein
MRPKAPKRDNQEAPTAGLTIRENVLLFAAYPNAEPGKRTDLNGTHVASCSGLTLVRHPIKGISNFVLPV